ncbi:MAG: hypothetical protein JWM88_1907 [Verrucomicrobia bacterium]|nr:hypothetical protein [Verrucomicrobiota bacterium]
MLKRHFYYYLLKPYLPRSMRTGLRRIMARWKRKKYRATWPIDEAAAKKPNGWQGWPDGKKFALVLTHDVEGPEGLARCRHLAEIEMKLGFRSSFNFIPEGSYSVAPELRAWLVENGFEVGVHDLKHDGKLYVNQAQFRRHALRINYYINEWNVDGFRSGFMHHHQAWLHDLNVRYDASSFDTDPFEPQPDGAGTIFPFWVPAPDGNGHGHQGTRFIVDLVPTPTRPSSSPLPYAPVPNREGYVELPYTLPQDSTLFMLLEEKTSEIWQQKLAWIVRNGGMALINVHPDYLHLQAPGPDPRPTAEDHYVGWLQHVKEKYGDTCWHALPREMATFVREWKERAAANVS